MAAKRLVIDGFAQLELNNVAFRRDGRVEAQCFLDKTDFEGKVAENGMILAIDNASRTIKLPHNGAVLYGLNYSAEHLYEDGKIGLKNFKLGVGDVLPRLGLLDNGDKFTTNCISYDPAVDTDWSDDDDVKEALVEMENPIYGGISADGSILISETKPAKGPVLLATNATTMPDGQFGVKFQVVQA
jgi:hypothetical protein